MDVYKVGVVQVSSAAAPGRERLQEGLGRGAGQPLTDAQSEERGAVGLRRHL